MSNYEPIDEDQIAEFRERVVSGMTRDVARQMLYELERCERERARLERDAEASRAGRMAVREALFGEMQDMRKKIAENEAWMRVAADSNKQIDAYLRSIDPTLEAEYGMPVDAVRYVIERLRQQ